MRYIWQDVEWPDFRWNATELQTTLADNAFRHGRFLGRLSGIGFELEAQAGLEIISEEIISSAAIEGETLNREDVRSSVARRMEIALTNDGAVNYAMDARAAMIFDAVRGWDREMSEDRLKSWHAALFPTGYSGLSKIRVGAYRDEAPDASRLKKEMSSFTAWLNAEESMPMVVKAALAHLRFLTIHPFDDGNGRLARALTEWVLARGERSELRFYSLSSEIQREKDAYYEEIERAQRNTMDVTRWISWFVGCHSRALALADEKLAKILDKSRFWQRHQDLVLNANQKRMLNALLDGFDGHLTSSKWAKICKVSQDTAGREIDVLVKAGVLAREGQGRSTHYVIRELYHEDAESRM